MPFQPTEVQIRHGIFWYFAKEKQVVPDATKGGTLVEQEVLVQRTARQNDKVTLILEADYRRGVDGHAFWTEDELKEARSGGNPPALTPEGGVGVQPTEDIEEQDPTEVDIAELDQGELVEWLQGSGQFDEYKTPNAEQVVAQVGDDAELAERVLAAERAARDKPRASVERPLTNVMERATA